MKEWLEDNHKMAYQALKATAPCADCGLAYADHGDCVIDNDLWKRIAPNDGEGILCANCMMRRLGRLGISRIPATLYPPFLCDKQGEPN